MDSREEEWFSWYIDELKDAGYMHRAIYQPASFHLSDPVKAYGLQIGKKVKEVHIHLLADHKYTADWSIEWNDNAEGIFFWKTGKSYKGRFYPYSEKHRNEFIPFIVYNGMTYVDIKGGFNGRNNSSASTFPINQKWVYDKLDELVQKIVITDDLKGLFYRTFTPQRLINDHRYTTTKVGKYTAGDSKLKYEPRTLEQFIILKQ